MEPDQTSYQSSRTAVLYAAVVLCGLIFAGRLFYLQVIKHELYRDQALSEQQHKFVLQAERGKIYGLDGDAPTPLVLNENLPTVYADPRFVEDKDAAAASIAEVLGGKASIYRKLLDHQGAYVVLSKRVEPSLVKKLKELDLAGIGFSDASYRVYPQRRLGSQLLGFVNDEGAGQYGLEGYLNDQLDGRPGLLKAVTDVDGIPLSIGEDNVIEDPLPGDDLTLTIDVNVQRAVEEAVARGARNTNSKSVSAIVMDPDTGAIKAMANYPTYDPAAIGKVKDYAHFSNPVVSEAYETGSTMKLLSMATGLNEGAVTPSTTYVDQGSRMVEGHRIGNANRGAFGTQTMSQVIANSLNTGVIFVLERLGGGEINTKARTTLYDYYTNRFNLGKATGVAQSGEVAGAVAAPDKGDGLGIRYANMAFGQGMTVTMLQMTSAVASLINGGTYYQPYLVHSIRGADGQVVTNAPNPVRKDVVSKKTSSQIRKMMESVVNFSGGQRAKRAGYTIGGKTGTAQIPDGKGGYQKVGEMGSFVGFGGNPKPKYIAMVRVVEPRIAGYAGSDGAGPVFAEISNYLIDYYQLPPQR